jgi:predicted nucleic acid-binding protein
LKFVDTSFWVALQLARDDRHELARRLWAARDGGGLVTSNHVLGETWTYLRRRADHPTAVAFIVAARQSPSLAILHVDRDLEAEAWSWLQRRGERTYSFVDATSFALMRQRRLREALAFDGDFSAAGFVEVRP